MQVKNETSKQSVPDKEKLEWIQTVKELNDIKREEDGGMRRKMESKITQNPFVPIGMVATAFALGAGLNAMRKGDKRQSQLMMRARVAAQGFTVAALLIGIVVAAKTKPA